MLGLTSCSTPHLIQNRSHPVRPDQKRIYQEIENDASHGWSVYRLDPLKTQILIYAYRGGVLAMFGHNHVIEALHEHGIWLTHGRQGRGWICIPLRALVIDAPQLRSQAGAGFRTPINTVEVEATRRHMLESLDARQYPNILISILTPARPSSDWRLRIRLHGVTRNYAVPVHDEPLALQAYGETQFSIKQTRFHIHPYSILAGALRVRDTLHLHAQVYAHRLLNPTMSYTEFASHWCK